MATRNSIGSNKPVEVSFGATGAATHTANGVLQGNGANPVTTINAAANGQTLIGANSGVNVFNTIAAGPNITVVNGPNTITVNYTGGGTGVVTDWTPQIRLTANTITPPTYSLQNGKYLLLGKLVIFTAEMDLTNKGTMVNLPPPSNPIRLTGLPVSFNAINQSQYSSQWVIEENTVLPAGNPSAWKGLTTTTNVNANINVTWAGNGSLTEFFGEITNTTTYRICGINLIV